MANFCSQKKKKRTSVVGVESTKYSIMDIQTTYGPSLQMKYWQLNLQLWGS